MITERTLLAAALAALSVLTPAASMRGAAQDATPTPVSCNDVAAPSADGTPAAMAGKSDTTDMDHMAMDLDLMYVDMMIPHHASIVAMAQAALPRLTDPRLQAMARSIIDAQSAEIEELRGYRENLYGAAEPMPMVDAMLAAMVEMMPGMSGSMKEMDFQMDSAAQVAVICAAKDVDLVFIDLTIPHHQMAIESSETIAAEAVHTELQEFAKRVIADQQREIDELEQIRASLTDTATPAQP